jgi:hypothetical protein
MKNVNNFFTKLQNTHNKNNFNFLDENVINFKLKNRELNTIKKIILLIIERNENKKFAGFKNAYNFLNKTKFYQLNKNLNDFVKLENIIIEILKKRLLLNNQIKGIEFPVGLRILHPGTPKQLTGKFQTTSIHCDPWAGEPDDMINVVMYFQVDKNTPKLMIKKISNQNLQQNYLMNNYYKNRHYLNSKKYFTNIEHYKTLSSHKLKHSNGECYLFKGFVPHGTIKEGDKIRIGLEFRLRTINPYLNVKRFLSKVNRSGRYWLLPSDKYTTFEQRLQNELIKIRKKKNSKKIEILRKRELSRYYGIKID